jgi:sphinganine-1-phosphate aldolase
MKLSTMQEKQKLFLKEDAKVDFGKVSGVKYTPNPELEKNAKDFLKEFIFHNPLHFDVFRGSRQMEAELLSMTGNLLGCPKVQ